MKIGKNMRRTLDFLRKCTGWITYAKDRSTVQAVHKLEILGLVETNKFHMMRLVQGGACLYTGDYEPDLA